MSEPIIQNSPNLNVKGPVGACCLSIMAAIGGWNGGDMVVCPACKSAWVQRDGNVTQLKVFSVYDGGECVWAITDDPEKARTISREYLRDSAHPEDYEGEDESITEMLPDAPLTLTISDDDPTKVTRTCAEWIADQGEGFLATTCF